MCRQLHSHLHRCVQPILRASELSPGAAVSTLSTMFIVLASLNGIQGPSALGEFKMCCAC